jgi:hypothetical protein
LEKAPPILVTLLYDENRLREELRDRRDNDQGVEDLSVALTTVRCDIAAQVSALPT